ncbi:MAG: amino acid permease [Acidimicrobiaceae bacterium]|nr:amino acid permease [Acidimicrobiaceae bacterium]
MANPGSLRRRLGVTDAVVIGAGSMIGAGVYVAWAPAARAAGDWLLVGLAIAGVVAFCNATSSAQLAAIYPESGGAYVYGRRQLSPFWGYVAGWGFVVGKTASCSAMALTLGAYLWPEQQRLAAALAVMVITGVNIGGLQRTVAVTKVLLAVSLVAIGCVVWVGVTESPPAGVVTTSGPDESVLGAVQAAGFLFFAFAGYARIATLGEEVRDPERTIPRAIPLALLGVLAVYALVGAVAIDFGGVDRLGGSDSPLRDLVGSVDSSLEPLVQLGAGIASLGVLLNLVPAVSRTTLAMARNGEVPAWFAHIDNERSLPLRAELTVAAVVIALVLTIDITSSIAVSGVAVLAYYAVTNAAALTLRRDQQRWPGVVAAVGLLGCVVLAAALPRSALLGGGLVLVTGVAARQVAARRSSNEHT